MEQRILVIYCTWDSNTDYRVWDIYPAGRKSLERVKSIVNNLENSKANVIVVYDELSEEVGRIHLDTIYKTGEPLSVTWKFLWEENLED